MNKKNQAGGHNTPQGGNRSGASSEDKSGQQNQQSGQQNRHSGADGGSKQGGADREANPSGQQAGSQEPKGNQGGK